MMRAAYVCLAVVPASGIKLDAAAHAESQGVQGTYSVLKDGVQVWQEPSMKNIFNRTLHTGDQVEIEEAQAVVGGDNAGKVVGRLTNMDENVTGWIFLEDPHSGEQAAKRTGPYNHKKERKERKHQGEVQMLAFHKKQKVEEHLESERQAKLRVEARVEAERKAAEMKMMRELQRQDSLVMTKARWEETYHRTVGWAPFQHRAQPVYDNFDQQEMKNHLDHKAAAAMAQQMLDKMESKEKWSFNFGQHMSAADEPADGYYAGNLDGLPAKGVPALKMAAGSNGFKPTEQYAAGTTTSFPSMLAVASTWSKHMVGKVANAIAEEVRAKGANVYLGPSLSVHRSPAGGRTFEQLAGEDPVLGARLAAAFVSTIQKRGVMSAVTGFGFHQQESIAHDANAVVDDRTAWELYYPPFEAAVNAGVGAVVCASNRVNGTDACANRNLLSRDLKGKMNFDGFVMSDRNAHAQSFAAGLDVSMTAAPAPWTKMRMEDGVPQPQTALGTKSGMVDFAHIGTMVKNVLTSIYRLRLQEHPGCTLPCTGNLHAIANSEGHQQTALAVAEEAIVLLTSYRNPSLKAAYPFGHGLSYTLFDIGAPEVKKAPQGFDINVVVTNTGGMAGKEVVQAYFEFPSLAKTPMAKLYPTKTLRGFLKTNLLQPGESQLVALHFSARDYVRWDVGADQWHLMPSIKAHVGSSSSDIRQQLSFNADQL